MAGFSSKHSLGAALTVAGTRSERKQENTHDRQMTHFISDKKVHHLAVIGVQLSPHSTCTRCDERWGIWVGYAMSPWRDVTGDSALQIV